MSCQATKIKDCRLAGCVNHNPETGLWINSVLRWSARGSTPEQIAKDLEVDVEDVRRQLELERLREKNNPENEPVGHYTGRCMKCHSRNLWDDASAYGCNDCGAIFVTG